MEGQLYPFISVVIPVRNAQKYLPKCLQSLKILEYLRDRYEVIVVDGLSTDNTSRIAEHYGAGVLINKRQAIVSGRNIGYKLTNFVNFYVSLFTSMVLTAILYFFWPLKEKYR